MTVAEMSERYRAGESLVQIANLARIGHSSVKRRLVKAGVKLRSAALASKIAREQGRAWTSKSMWVWF